MTTQTFTVYVAYYDHTDTIAREAMLKVRAIDAAHAEMKATASREWNFAVTEEPERETAGIGEDLL